MNGLGIDVREYPEYAAAHITGTRLVPLGTLQETSASWDRHEPLTLICKSGRRAEQARQMLVNSGFTSLTVLEGGIDAWRIAGKPLDAAQRRPWSLERQVRTAAGSLILITMALAYSISNYFFFATAFIGAGLVFAGVSDTCMMGMALAKLPWNQPARS